MTTYTLQLDENQFLLICRLVSQIRLGAKTPFSDAAFDLCNQFEQIDGRAFDSCYDKVPFTVTVENSMGIKAVEIQGDDAIFEV